MRIFHAFIFSGVFTALFVGCGGNKVHWSEGATEGYQPSGFQDVEGTRSDAPLGEPMRDVDYDQRLSDHMNNQNPRRSERD